MKTKHLLATLAMCCAVTALVGCASTDHQMSESSLDEKNLEGDEAPSSTALSQPAILCEHAFRGLDSDTNGAVTLDQWQHFDTNVEPRKDFRTLDENDGQINATGFLTEAPKHSKLDSVLEGAERTNNHSSWDSWDRQEFQPQGLQLFSIGF